MRRLIYLFIIVVSLSLIATDVLAKPDYMPKPPQQGSEYNPADYVALQSIGAYNNDGKGACLKGSGRSIGATHFDLDHYDFTCDTVYINEAQDIVVSVEVTKHAGADSDRWLLHELERGVRRGESGENMTSTRFRNISGNKIFYSGLGGGAYRWLSSGKIINIEYIDLYRQKAEPLEIINVYLQKYPSTIPSLTIDKAHNETWIKDEMDRRLWLCDKWNAQSPAGSVTQADLIYNLVSSMGVFLNYRQRYYGVAAQADLDLLDGYKQSNDLTSIQTKLTEYKTWWAKHKGDSISLP